ncbi:hypothetical protein KSC_044310 [Ktedonobacter sp. SOSP1-52]|nr:hypothetical protein KSC_044310 [Ktedonobacter sp. SOSP1-52]
MRHSQPNPHALFFPQNKDTQRLLLQRGAAYALLGAPEQARQDLHALLQRTSGRRGGATRQLEGLACLVLAVLATAQDRYPDALPLWKQARAWLQPQEYDLLAWTWYDAKVLIQLRHLHKAHKVLSNILTPVSPDPRLPRQQERAEAYAELYAQRGGVCSLLRSHQEAIEDLNAAIRLHPTCARFFHIRGLLHAKQQHWQAAYHDLWRALHEMPEDPELADCFFVVMQHLGTELAVPATSARAREGEPRMHNRRRPSAFTRQLQELRASLPPDAPDPLIDPPPDAFLHLWECAKAEGIEVSTLLVVRQPLDFRAAGAYSIEDRDIWVWYSSDISEEQALRTLLHELAHAQCPPKLPYASFEEEWAEERATWQRAIALAHTWEMAHLFSQEIIAELLEEVEACLQQRLATSAVLGSADMERTERALKQLWLEADARGWTGALLHDVLTGANTDPGLLGEVLTFDRCVLHACWEVAHEPEEDPDPGMLFGPLSRLGEGSLLVYAVGLLQRTLASCAHQEKALRTRLATQPWQVVTSGTMSYERSRRVVQDETSLQEAIVLVNQLCFEAHGYALRMNWQCFNELFSRQDQMAYPARLYCLHLFFTPWAEVLTDIISWIDPEMLPACQKRLPKAVWFLFPRGEDTTLLEATWQLFLLSWTRCAEINYEGSLFTPESPLQSTGASQQALSSEGTEGDVNTMGGTA